MVPKWVGIAGLLTAQPEPNEIIFELPYLDRFLGDKFKVQGQGRFCGYPCPEI